jgi:hypothetical protein
MHASGGPSSGNAGYCWVSHPRESITNHNKYLFGIHVRSTVPARRLQTWLNCPILPGHAFEEEASCISRVVQADLFTVVLSEG